MPLTELNINELGKLNAELANLSHIEFDDLGHSLASEGESQTRRRLSEEKTSPDGKAWPAWSEQYAKKRESHHSLLENEGNLIDSIESGVNGDEVFWGSNIIYANTHQHGDAGRGIPARKYLGFSPKNKKDFAELINDFLSGVFRFA